jgi:hypothetical protein
MTPRERKARAASRSGDAASSCGRRHEPIECRAEG